jgi:hypothetical protein
VLINAPRSIKLLLIRVVSQLGRTHEFLENEDLMMVSSTTVIKQAIKKENEEKEKG